MTYYLIHLGVVPIRSEYVRPAFMMIPLQVALLVPLITRLSQQLRQLPYLRSSTKSLLVATTPQQACMQL